MQCRQEYARGHRALIPASHIPTGEYHALRNSRRSDGFAFALLQAAAVIPGAVLPTRTIWLMAEIINGLMAIPNLIALAVLSPVFFRLIIDYKRKSGISGASGGNYADFHQCKPL